MKRWLAFSVLVLVANMSFAAEELKVGDLAPDVVLDGIMATGEPVVQSVNASAGENHSYTIIEFFYTDDAQSHQNLFPLFEIARDTAEHAATKLVAVDRETADVKAYVKNNKGDIAFPVLFDNHGGASRAFGLKAVPTIFVLRDEKKVIFKHTGVLTPQVRTELLRAIGY